MLRKSPFPIKESRGKHGCLICGSNQIWVGIDKRSRIGPEAGKLGSGPKVPAFDSCSRTGFDRKQLPWIFQRDSRPNGFNATHPKGQRPKNKRKVFFFFTVLGQIRTFLLTTDILAHIRHFALVGHFAKIGHFAQNRHSAHSRHFVNIGHIYRE